MAKIRFFTRTISKDKNSLVPVFVRVRIGSKIDITCKADILVKPENWSNETQQSRQRADLHKFKFATTEESGRDKLNEKVAGLRRAIESELTSIHPSDLAAKIKDKDPQNRKAKNEALTKWLETIIDRHWHPHKYRTNMFTFIQDFIDQAPKRPMPKTNRPICYKQIKEYERTFYYLKKLSKETGKEYDWQDIDMNFYYDFITYLQKPKTKTLKNGKEITIPGLCQNTVGKKVQTLKIFLNAASEQNLNKNMAYKSHRFTAINEESEQIYLNEDSLKKIAECQLSPNLGVIRDLFLVGAWTGLRFSDWNKVSQKNISNGCVELKQQKTGAPVVIPLHSEVKRILNKYDGKLPQIISNQKFNAFLKEIAQTAELNGIISKTITRGGVRVTKSYKTYELVSTHTARRSFATNLYKQGLSTLTIMKITGHRTEESFLKYIKVTPDEHARKLQEHWDNRHLKVV